MKHISGVGRGKGFTDADEQKINNIIAIKEVSDYCQCDVKVSDIYNSLNQLYENKTNIICSKFDDTHMIIAPIDDKWLVTKVKACYYSVYLS